VKLFQLILVSSLLFSCSKNRKTERLLPGTWAVEIVRIEDGEGFLFYDSMPQGSWEINNSQISGKVNYTYNYFNQFTITDSASFAASNYLLDTKNEVFSIIRETDTLRAKIIMLTKKSFTFEYYDQLAYRLKRFTCVRE
jgi:hypothetical protein